MFIRTSVLLSALFYTSATQSQILTIAAGQTFGSARTEHDAYRVEANFAWKPELWTKGDWALSLNHAVSVMSFRDRNTVNAFSWAPNIVIAPRSRNGIYPYVQLSFGAAYLSDDQFESETGEGGDPLAVTEMGSHGQFESGLALGLINRQFSVRAKIYHYSNASLANENDGMDIAEFGVSYSF
ncbi:MAG: acyloxyacyl hydrolase [Halioglobus sp.]